KFCASICCAEPSGKRSHRTPMNQKELRELIEFLIEKDIAEFELERGDVKVKIRRAGEHTVVHSREMPYVAVPVQQSGQPSAVPSITAPSPVAAVAPAPEENLHLVKSPIVGTFYEAPSPGAPPFVKVGDMVEVGQVLCIVEAMKLLNEIESDVAGEIVKKMGSNGQPIEYGQELFAVRVKN
ncbi:MAG: acetyl-CoA carboxylase biotin carboxyl carrier protein, partial [Acidobacteriaceae bacterium]